MPCRVVHGDLQVRVDALQQHLHLAALGVNFTALVSRFQTTCCSRVGRRHRPGQRVEDLLQSNALAPPRAHRFDRRVDDVRQLDPLHVQPHLAGNDPAHVEQVFNQLRLRAALRSIVSSPCCSSSSLDAAHAQRAATSPGSRSAACAARATASPETRPSSGSPVPPRCGGAFRFQQLLALFLGALTAVMSRMLHTPDLLLLDDLNREYARTCVRHARHHVDAFDRRRRVNLLHLSGPPRFATCGAMTSIIRGCSASFDGVPRNLPHLDELLVEAGHRPARHPSPEFRPWSIPSVASHHRERLGKVAPF